MNKKGFTLIELMVVIAIIAILSAIIFPIMATVDAKTEQSTCMNNLRQVGLALDMFYADNKKYPNGLAPEVQYNGTNVIPMNEVNGNLLQNGYLASHRTLHCPMDDRFEDLEDVSVITYKKNNVNITKEIYSYSSYEAYINDETITTGDKYTDPTAVLSYNLNWWKGNGGATNDNYIRQLKWKNPPSNTVVCWCMNHADYPYSNNQKDYPTKGNSLVLFLDGHVDVYTNTSNVASSTWTTKPLN